MATTENKRAYMREYGKKYRAINREAIARKGAEYRALHREEILAKARAKYLENRAAVIARTTAHSRANRERYRGYMRDYDARNREKRRLAQAARRAENLEKKRAQDRAYARNRRSKPQERILNNLRTRTYAALKGFYKSAPTTALLGCTIEELKAHLSAQFTPDMSWDNYGSYWHIDHIRPCAAFNLIDPEEQRICFHWSNLQPLPAIENIRKHAKLDWKK